MDRFRMMPTYHFYSVEGNSPLKLEKSVGKPLRDYKIYGACGDLVTDETDANYGKYKIPIVVGGKNLVNEVFPGIMGHGSSYGKMADTSSKIYRTVHLKNLKPGNYIFSLEVPITITKLVSTNNHDINVSVDVKNPATGYVQHYGLTSYKVIITQFEEDVYFSFRDTTSGTTAWNDSYWVQAEMGETATEYEPYKEPFTADIYLNEPLADGEYIDFIGQKLVKVDSEQPISLPKINTFKGLNIVSVDTETQPSNMKIQYYK